MFLVPVLFRINHIEYDNLSHFGKSDLQYKKFIKFCKMTFVLPFLSNSIKVESRACAMLVALAATVTTGGARGDTNCAEVAEVAGAGDAGEAADARMVDSGGGAGVTKPARDTTLSVLVPIRCEAYS